jgi:hypothetical protein
VLIMSSRRKRRLTVRVAAVLVAGLATLGPARAGAHGREGFQLRSTLDGVSVLPHRIRWVARPGLPPTSVESVAFSIDGRLRWIEHNPPYSYGFDGNYLVTSWLAPGSHSFTVRATARDGRRATRSTVARVPKAAPPPRELAGRWFRTVTSGLEHGAWELEVDEVGWRFQGRGATGALVDVGYLSVGLLEARGGIHTKNRSEQEGNQWCNEPFQPVRYRWWVAGDTLTLRLAGPSRCDGQPEVWAGRWSRTRKPS